MNYTTAEYLEKLDEELTVRMRDMVILVCAILIASIGLNLNATPVIIGAMLISPLMTPILGLGFGLAIYDVKLLQKSFLLLLVELAISLLVSFVYFSLSPVAYPSSEILARTAPTVWDILIATAGGTAGVIGSRQKERTNIVPGVAIATALMPPICTVGFGLAQGTMKYALGAAHLFLINCLFIMLATYIGSQLLMKRTRPTRFRELSPRLRGVIVSLVILVTIPSAFSAVNLVKDHLRKEGIASFIQTELADQLVLQQTYHKQTKELKLTLAGGNLSDAEIDALISKLEVYGLADITVRINQIAAHTDFEQEEFFAYIDKYIDQKIKQERLKDKNLEEN